MRNEEFDSKIIMYPARRISMLLFMALAVILTTTVITEADYLELPWYSAAVPIIGIGLAFIFVPPTEEWEYKPWQGRARRIEVKIDQT